MKYINKTYKKQKKWEIISRALMLLSIVLFISARSMNICTKAEWLISNMIYFSSISLFVFSMITALCVYTFRVEQVLKKISMLKMSLH